MCCSITIVYNLPLSKLAMDGFVALNKLARAKFFRAYQGPGSVFTKKVTQKSRLKIMAGGASTMKV